MNAQCQYAAFERMGSLGFSNNNILTSQPPLKGIYLHMSYVDHPKSSRAHYSKQQRATQKVFDWRQVGYHIPRTFLRHPLQPLAIEVFLVNIYRNAEKRFCFSRHSRVQSIIDSTFDFDF